MPALSWAGLSWLVGDQVGTNTVQVDAKALTATHRYTDPFGQPRSALPSWIGDRGYVGGTEDPTTGLTNLGAREYDPTTGRFLSADPVTDSSDPQQLNGYAYADNSPITHSDPSGLRPQTIRDGTIWDDGEAGEKRFVAWMDAYTGGTAWRRDYWALNKTWEADKKAHHRDGARDHQALDLLGYVPVIGTVADAANAIWYATEGNWTQAGLSAGSAAIGLIPAGKLLKLAGKGVVKLGAKAVEKAGAKLAEKAAAKGLEKAAGKSVEKAAARGGEKAAGRGAERSAAGCVPHSFPAETPVQLADGGTKPISKIKIGDKIRNADPDASKTQTHRVDGVIVTTTDRDLVDLTITTPDGPRTLTTTRHHLFWDTTTHHWTQATNLTPGHHLQTPTGSAPLAAIHRYTHTGTTYDLTINHLHTYYVVAGATSILVHNCGGARTAVSDLRASGQVGSRRNIAAAEVAIGGQDPYVLSSVSGDAERVGTVPVVGSEGNPQRFIPRATGSNVRFSDTEFKLLNSIANGLGPSSGSVTGVINLHSELPLCESCSSVVSQFREAFPGINLNVTTG